MNLGEILDRTFQIYRSRFLLFVGIAALPAFVMFALHLADISLLRFNSLVRAYREPGFTLWNFLVWLAYYHVSTFLGMLILPAFVKQVTSVLEDEVCSIRSALQFVWLRFKSFLWIAILKLLASLVIPEMLAFGLGFGLITAADAAGAMKDGRGVVPSIVVLFGFAVGIGLFAWLGACLAFAVLATAIEKRKGFKSLRRSWQLTRESRGRIFVSWFTIGLLQWAMAMGLEFMIRFIMIEIVRLEHLAVFPLNAYTITIYLLFAAVSAFVGPLYPIALTLIYYDQRIRREGFDIEWMMSAAGLNVPAAPPAGARETAPPSVRKPAHSPSATTIVPTIRGSLA
jgi:hypothetical protein